MSTRKKKDDKTKSILPHPFLTPLLFLNSIKITKKDSQKLSFG